jgi:hypothetical protein
MTFAKSLWSDLVEKRLWPLALGLVVALIAVPVVLSRPAGENEPQTSPSGPSFLGGESSSLLGETKPIVSLGREGGFRKHIARLGRKNPFVQQAQPGGKAEGAITPGAGADTGASVPGTGAELPTPTVPTTPTSPGQTVYQYTATVRFGKIGETSTKTLDLTDALPSDEDAVTIFLGADGDDALFLVSTNVTARGDGRCEPSESNCSILRMKKDDVEFFEVSGAGDTVTTYELELQRIGKKQLSSSTPGLQSKSPLPKARSQRAQRARQALRAKKIFKALDLLGL